MVVVRGCPGGVAVGVVVDEGVEGYQEDRVLENVFCAFEASFGVRYTL